jgi:hypothetical protein
MGIGEWGMGNTNRAAGELSEAKFEPQLSEAKFNRATVQPHCCPFRSDFPDLKITVSKNGQIGVYIKK